MMDHELLGQLDAELQHAGEQTVLSPQMLLLEQLRITPEKELPKMEFLFRLFGKPCFPRRELVAITGKAKSGKTYVTSMLMAEGAPLGPPEGGMNEEHSPVNEWMPFLQRAGEKPLRVLWYDTEQSDESTQDILCNRIMKMATNLPSRTGGVGGGLDIFNVRCVDWRQRRALLREAVVRYGPDLVIVDGIRDLVNDINDGVLAQEVMEELLQLATSRECCIVCVLHQNKSGEDHNLRGWIGTELMNKAFEVYACEKLMPQRIFKVEQTLTRKYDIEQALYFEVGEDGLPKASPLPPQTHPRPLPVEGGEKSHEERLPQLNAEYIVHDENGGWQFDVLKLFLDAMHGDAEVGGAELRKRVMDQANIVQFRKYNQLLKQAIEQKVIVKTERDNLTFYSPAPF